MNVAGRWMTGLILLTACGDADSVLDVETRSDITEVTDTTPDTSDTPDVVVPPLCPATAGGHRTAFDPTLEPARPGALAADFDVETLAGRFHLADRWDGCESVVVFVHFPGITDSLWRSDASLLFTEGHPHVSYLFVSDDPDPDQRVEDLLVAERSIEAALRTTVRDEADRDRWRQRIHYVTGRARELDGGLGDYVRSELAFGQTPESKVDLGERGVAGLPAPVVFGIDRQQRFDAGDNLSPAVGAPEALSMAAFLPRFYAWRAITAQARAREDRIVFYDDKTTERILEVELDLSESSIFDNLENQDNATRAFFDVEIDCEERNPFACSEWDRIAHIALCRSTDCADRLELARWITPYWRRGLQRYRLEVSHLLPLLARTNRLRVELGPDWERPTPWRVTLSFHLEHQATDDIPRGVIALHGGGAFEPPYGGDRAFTVPVDATRVALYVLVSGHGQTAADNCAEWCDHRHHFAIDGAPIDPIRHEGAALGEPRGCAAQADAGVIPGQWGNWAQQRAYWCPGLPVAWQVRDLTALVTPGAEHLLSLDGTLGSDRPPAGGDIALTTVIVWY